MASALSFPPPPNCPTGMHVEGGTCVLDAPATHYPTTDKNPVTPAPTPKPAGGSGEQPGDCAAKGMVWRADTKACEYPDARSKAGQDTCGGDMPNCPPGQDVWCDFDTATFKCAQSQFSDAELCGRQNRIRRDMGKPEKSCAELGFGGGGGGAAGGARGSGSFGPSAESSAFGADLGSRYTDLLNQPSRFTPEALQAMYGEIARQASGAITRGTRAVQQNAAQRGMSRAGATGAAIRDVRNQAEIARGQQGVQVQLTKINTDHQDKLDALDRAQKYLDSMRDNEYRYALFGEQRRQFDSNLALAYANLTQQRTMLNMQLQSQWDMLKANQAFWFLTQGV